MFGGGDGFADGDFVELDAEALGEVGGVATAVFAGNGGGEGDADDVFGAHGLGGEGANDGGVDPATETEEDAFESAFMSVIAEAEDEGLMDGGQSNGVVMGRDVGVLGLGKIDAGVLGLEGGESGEDAALGVMNDAAAVEDEFIVTADGVAVNDGAVAAFSGGADEGFALACFAGLPWAGGKVEEVVELGAGELAEGIGGVAGVGGQVGLRPDVFADGESDFKAVPFVDGWGGGGLEVAGFVEDVVGGQKGFASECLDGTVFAPCGGVIAGTFFVDDGTGDEGDGSGLGGKGSEGVLYIADKAGLEEEVAGRVTAGGEFGCQDELRAGIDQFAVGLEEAGAVAGEVSDGGIDLCDSYFHAVVRAVIGKNLFVCGGLQMNDAGRWHQNNHILCNSFWLRLRRVGGNYWGDWVWILRCGLLRWRNRSVRSAVRSGWWRTMRL